MDGKQWRSRPKSAPRGNTNVFSVLFPESLRVIEMREAAYVALSKKLPLLEA
jgi:hypothetical protein